MEAAIALTPAAPEPWPRRRWPPPEKANRRAARRDDLGRLGEDIPQRGDAVSTAWMAPSLAILPGRAGTGLVSAGDRRRHGGIRRRGSSGMPFNGFRCRGHAKINGILFSGLNGQA
ncbi:hypothetical protein [Burkholderia plantarii]|uniref:hypothetical protein n=1 Tax=Burkholderia plantarii TaxID=41899 RepID=UPI0018DC4BA6|nr:hypothetical protein [Burkholderia plantarii]MBI0331643.1 hypothetical protein [Burkholderia plantarii]